ncbi:MAG: hypothetical protein NTZ72_00660, partial [Afipia sp.]|nr:hypothetical protein [Afipia sp.]
MQQSNCQTIIDGNCLPRTERFMRITRKLLRAAAQGALESSGHRVVADTKRGGVPGTRLKISSDLGDRTVAVRTSLKRKVGLMRDEHGDWRTVPDVDQVVIAVPADTSGSSIEVLGFDAKDIVAAFDAAARHQIGLAVGSPVFVSLDALKSKNKQTTAGLKKKAKWTKTIPLDEKSLASMNIRAGEQGLIERFKRDLAELHGVA